MTIDPFLPLDWKKRLGEAGRRLARAVARPLRPSRLGGRREGPPDLLVLAVDTLRWDHLGLGGSKRAASPGIDALGRDGVVFADVTAPAPWTLPSFASSLCGLMPCLHGAFLPGPSRNMDTQPPLRLRAEVPTLARHLAGRGYRTAAFYSNQFFGFGLAESFQEHAYHNLPADALARIALEWIRRHADRPFFCFVLMNDPHEPTTPAPRHVAPYLAELARRGIGTDGRRLRGLARWTDPRSGVHLGRTGSPLAEAEEEALAVKLALYAGAVAHVDRAVDAVRARLLRWRLLDRTVLALYSDHGEEFLEHADAARRWDHDPRGLRGIGHGHTLFQELLHVPWLAAGGTLPSGVRVDAPASLCDVAPTLADWLGLDPLPSPEVAMPELRGHSLAGIAAAAARSGARQTSADGSAKRDTTGDVTGRKDATPGRLLLSEEIAFGPDLVALRRDGWKLVATRAGKPLALFDLAHDPAEREDRREAEPERTAALLEKLATWNRARPRDERTERGDWRDLSGTVRDRLRDLGYAD